LGGDTETTDRLETTAHRPYLLAFRAPRNMRPVRRGVRLRHEGRPWALLVCGGAADCARRRGDQLSLPELSAVGAPWAPRVQL